jgi:hypothetical protein
MRREAHQRLILIAQLMIVGGLGLAVLWNVADLLDLVPALRGWGLLLPLPGLLLWPAALALPRLLAAVAVNTNLQSYRLTYDAPAGWPEEKARQALANLAATLGRNFGLTWAREQEGAGCWLCLPTSYETVLRRLVADMFPAGQIEADPLPPAGDGVVVLRWQEKPPPAYALCQLEGIEGVCYHRRSAGTAVVALWGAQAVQVARSFARKNDLLMQQAQMLRRPRFAGDDPWPDLPAFPLSQNNPGLTSVAWLERTAPGLRVNGSQALVLGRDSARQRAGFAAPDLDGLQSAAIWGQAAEALAINLAGQAVRAGLPVLFLDGRGSATGQLGRRLFREVATGQVLVCDTGRPARSHFRLNPLWLPDTVSVWPAILNTTWLAWLHELGVTLAGLGQDAFRHTRVAVILTALAAAQQSLALDVAGLRDALEAPDFLGLLEPQTLAHAEVLDKARWQWWLSEGRQTPKFDLRLRLAHLRDRLNMLLVLPEYELLWQPPYFDPLLVADGKNLFWRFPQVGGRLRPYVSSQLAAIATLLHVWPQTRPILVFVHELPLGRWARELRVSPALRLVVSGQRMQTTPERSDTLLLSRLHKDDAQQLGAHLDGIRAAGLRRLADTRLLVRRGSELGTIDFD